MTDQDVKNRPSAAPSGAGPAARLPIDPRLRQRRIEVRREEGRRRLRLLVSAAAVVLLGALGWATTRSPLFRVHRTVVTGASRTSTADILRAAGLAHHRQMVDLDTGAMERAVEALPWIDRAKVLRHWPTTVTVSVTERRPVGVVTDRPGMVALVDVTGRVLVVVVAPPPRIPAVAWQPPAPPAAGGGPGGGGPGGGGPDGGGAAASAAGVPVAGDPGTTVPAQLGPALGVASAVSATLPGRVAVVWGSPDGSITLSLFGGASALLGSPDDLGAKLTALATVLSKVPVGAGTIDVRVPDAPVLTPTSPGH